MAGIMSALVLVVTLLGVFWTSPADAQNPFRRLFRATLNGFQEVLNPVGQGAVSTPGSGQFRATLRNNDTVMDYELSYEDLIGDVLQAHIHFGQPSTTGGIVVWLCQTPPAVGPRRPGADMPGPTRRNGDGHDHLCQYDRRGECAGDRPRRGHPGEHRVQQSDRRHAERGGLCERPYHEVPAWGDSRQREVDARGPGHRNIAKASRSVHIADGESRPTHVVRSISANVWDRRASPGSLAGISIAPPRSAP